MDTLSWIYILYILAGIPSLYFLLKLAIDNKSLIESYYGAALLSFLTGVILTFFESYGINPASAREWGDLVAITLILCGLFVRIRNSKPVFARFPQPLTALPLLIIIFYPMIVDAEVIKDLLMTTFQGGALIVGLLMVSINQFKHKNRLLTIIGFVILSISYVLFWYVPSYEEDVIPNIARVLFTAGMIISVLGFRKTANTDN